MTVTTITDTQSAAFQSPAEFVYATALADDALAVYQPFLGGRLGQFFDGSQYTIYRLGVYFDMSGIPPGSIVSAAKIIINVFNIRQDLTDYAIQVQNGQPTYPHNPAVDNDMDEGHYTGDGGQSVLASVMIAGDIDIPLNATGIGWLNLGGLTKFMIRSTADIGASPPNNQEWLDYWGPTHDVGQEVRLEVTWTGGPTGPVREPALKKPLYARPISGIKPLG
jgi:hypothetical protein